MTSSHGTARCASEDARSSKRFLAHLPAVVHHKGRDFECRAYDLSRSGVLLFGDIPIPPETVRFSLRSPSRDLVLTVEGRLARVDEDAMCRNRLGIEFGEMDEEQRQTLEALVSRVAEGMAPAALEELPEHPTPSQVRAALESIPLPHRVALAKRATPRERELLLHDPTLQVIDALARNPNLLPHEARALLRIRALPSRTLEAMAGDVKWGGSETFRMLIASHPNTPLALGEKLASGLSVQALRKLVQTPGLNPVLRFKLARRFPDL